MYAIRSYYELHAEAEGAEPFLEGRSTERAQSRRGTHKATVALANKMARIAWAISAREIPFEPRSAAS